MIESSQRRTGAARDRNSVPILVVRLGPARDFLLAMALLVLVLGVAALIAFLAYG